MFSFNDPKLGHLKLYISSFYRVIFFQYSIVDISMHMLQNNSGQTFVTV